MFVTRGYD